MKKLVENFKRKEIFDHYHSMTNPFSVVTTKIDITKLYHLAKKNKNTYATIGYYITKALNEIDEFKYRYEDGKIYYYDRINPNFTQMFEDETIGYFTCEMTESYEEFLEEYNKTYKEFLKNHRYISESGKNEVWLSCEPWFHFSGLVTPFDKETTIPQIIWDQFTFEEDHCYINIMLMHHHGFVDGYHIGLYFRKLKEIIEEIEN